MQLGLPFNSKEMPDGKKLFRRVHGIQATLAASGNTEVEFLVPYNWCKITGARLLWFPEGVKADFFVLDSEAGLVQSQMGVPPESIVPFKVLNQFGFDANCAVDFFIDDSPYDADLYLGMKFKAVLKNASATSKVVGVNLVLHEVK